MRIETDIFMIKIKGTCLTVVIDANKKLDEESVVRLMLNSDAEQAKQIHIGWGDSVEVAICDEPGTTFYNPEKRLLKTLKEENKK